MGKLSVSFPSKEQLKHLWHDLKLYRSAPVVAMLFLGFSAGMPYFLIFSSLSLWLGEAGVSLGTITFFSWAALGYSFKFVWAPLVEVMPIPWLTRKLGWRRSWLVISQIMVIFSICFMAMVNPSLGQLSLILMACAAVLLGFSSATQDIVIDAYRIESAPSEHQAALAATYTAGYRVGLIVSGAGPLFLAQYLGSSMESYLYSAWRTSYLVMSAFMLVGLVTVLVRPEPLYQSTKIQRYDANEYLKFFLIFILMVFSFILPFQLSAFFSFTETPFYRFLSALISVMCAIFASLGVLFLAIKYSWIDVRLANEAYIAPVREFVSRYPLKVVLLLLLLIGSYRISDIVLGAIANVFYQNLGFSKQEIASVVKTFGLVMTLLGGFIGGLLCLRLGVIRMMFWGALLSALTNVLFMLLAQAGYHLGMLYLVIAFDNLAGGLATAAFIAFLSSLTNISFTATQYAIFSSLMTLFPKLIGGYSGTIVHLMGYSNFFILTATMGLPVIGLIWALSYKKEVLFGKKMLKYNLLRKVV